MQNSGIEAAFTNSNTEIISILLQNGADVNAKDHHDFTALISAAANNSNPEVISVLLKNGADANMKCDWGERAIDFARRYRHIKYSKAYQELKKATDIRWWLRWWFW